MNRKNFMNDYWRYYILLEKKFIGTLNFVELAKENFSTYSIEYAHQFLAVGSELDTFFKVYCGFNLEDSSNIVKYTKYFLETYPEIKSQKINVVNTDIQLTPYLEWENFDHDKSENTLTWWKAYNKVKHNRSGCLTKATLENLLNALSALYLVEMKYLQIVAAENQEIDEPDWGNNSEIFDLVNWKFNKSIVRSILDGTYKSQRI